MNRRCFIAISTGQNIANVAPLLAVARPEDTVVFIETAEAARRGWTQPALDVLRTHGLTQLRPLRLDSNDPADLYQAVKQFSWPTGEKIIVGNGGTKPQSMALYEALRADAPAILYSLDRPCQLQWFEGGPAAAVRGEAYASTRLTLEDVLSLRGMRLHTPGQALWNEGGATQEARLRAAVNKGYGIEAAQTFVLHDAHHRFDAERRLTEPPGPLPRWAHIERAAPDEAAKFVRAYANALRLPPESLLPQAQAQISGLFNAAAGIIERSLRPRSSLPSPPPLGEAFERALTSRLCRLLAGHDLPTEHILGIWRNIKIDSPKEPGVIQLEADLLILLKNGLMLAIEAKSHTAETKELDARLANLQRAGSQLARIIVCSPLYTEAAQRDWFRTHHEFAQRVRRHGLSHLAYTLPGQAGRYTLPTDAVQTQEYTVEDFDTACRRLVLEYAPRS